MPRSACVARSRRSLANKCERPRAESAEGERRRAEGDILRGGYGTTIGFTLTPRKRGSSEPASVKSGTNPELLEIEATHT